LGNIDPIGGLYVGPPGTRIPNAAAVHTVVKNENGEWLFSSSTLCIFREPILIIDIWDKQISAKQKMHFYIALYKDNTIAVPIKWIKGKNRIYGRVEDGTV
jgi:hypothetical protein